LARGFGQPADGVHQGDAVGEGIDPEMGAGTEGEHSPVVHAIGRPELAR
jgi:hypothetical protein